MAPSRCSPQPLFQRYHRFSVPEIIQNHSLSSFPPVQSSMAEVSHRGDEDSLADPYFKANSLQVPETPHTRRSDEREQSC